MRDLCTCYDVVNNVIRLQHKEIKTLFDQSLHLVGQKTGWIYF